MGTQNAPGEGNNIPNTLPQNNEQKVNAVKRFVGASLLVLSVQAGAVEKTPDVNHIPSVKSTSSLVSSTKSTDNQGNVSELVDNGTVDLRTGTKSVEKTESKVKSEFLPNKEGVELTDPSGSKMSVTWTELKDLSPSEQTTLLKMLRDDQKNAYQAYILSQSSPSASLQGTKELGYGQMASNGESFEKLATLSPEEMGKLPPKIQEELEVYMDQQVNQKKEVVVSKQVESKELDKVVVSLDKRIAGQKEEIGTTVAKIIPGLLAEAKAGKKVILPKETKETIQMIAEGKLPPPAMQARAQELMIYLN